MANGYQTWVKTGELFCPVKSALESGAIAKLQQTVTWNDGSEQKLNFSSAEVGTSNVKTVDGKTDTIQITVTGVNKDSAPWPPADQKNDLGKPTEENKQFGPGKKSVAESIADKAKEQLTDTVTGAGWDTSFDVNVAAGTTNGQIKLTLTS